VEVIFEIVEKSKSTYYKVNKSEATIGRDAESCDIVIQDNGSSKNHCMLEFKQNKWWAVDLNSKNGTFIKSTPIKRIQIFLDDVIQIGECYIRFASSKMPLTTCQRLRRSERKYSHNKSITLLQNKKITKEQLVTGIHHGLKEITGIYDDQEPREIKMLTKMKKKKKKILKKT